MTLSGADVSHYQSALDVGAVGLDFVIMKATEGTGYTDPTLATFYAQARASGVLRGLYHFYRGNPTAEADRFLSVAEPYVGDALLALDFEDGAYEHDVAGALAFLDRVRDRTGVAPVLYMSRSFLTGSDWSPVVARGYALWLARYASDPGSPAPWPALTLWQHTSQGRLPGYSGPVDLDHFYGDAAAWGDLATGSEHREDGFLMALSDAEQREILDFVRDGGATQLNRFLKEVPSRSASEFLDAPLGQDVGDVEHALEDTRVISRRTEQDVIALTSTVDAIVEHLGIDVGRGR